MDSIINEGFPDISELIFGLLPPEDFLKCLSVCKAWKKIIEENANLWHIIGTKIMNKYKASIHREELEHLSIFEQNLQSHEDIEKVQYLTRILIWYNNGNKLTINISRPSPLTYCVMKSPERLEFLLTLSEDKNPSHSSGSILNHAARCGKLDSIKAITQYLENKNPRTGHQMELEFGFGKTPLELSIYHNHPNCVEYFIDFISDREVMSAMKKAAQYGRLQPLRIVTSNLDQRDLLNDNSLHGPLCLALENYHEDCFRFLIDQFDNVEGFVRMLLFPGFRMTDSLKAVIEYAYTRKLTRPNL